MQSTERLKSLFLQTNLASPIILLGAGASLKSGIPLSGQIVEMAAKWAYCQTQGFHLEDPSVRRSDWLKWLERHSWFDGTQHAEDNYSVALENLLQPRENRKQFFLRLLDPNVPASPGYNHLLETLDTGRVHTILTTNFDHVLPDLHVMRRRPHFLEQIKTPADYIKFSTSPAHPQMVYLHGSVEHYTDKNLIEEVQNLERGLITLLSPVIRDHPLIVVGYRGAEPSIMHHLLLDQCGATNNFHQGIYWCTLSDSAENLHPLVKELASRIGSNFQAVHIKGFDEVMTSIAEVCSSLPHLYSISHPSSIVSNGTSLPFDMRALLDANLDELDWGRAELQMIAYCRRTKMNTPPTITRDWLIQRMMQLDLLQLVDGSARPTNGGYLLFATNPCSRIVGAHCELIIDGETRRLDGNLWSQRERLDEFFAEINPPFRLKGAVSEIVYPYPVLALKELLINALVHRSYEVGEPLRVELEQTFIRLINPGGLVPSVFQRVSTRLQQEIALGVRGITGYRNAVLADIFYGAGAMDKEGSGLPDVHTEVLQNESTVFFGPIDETNQRYRALIYRRIEEADADTNTARPAIPKSRYFSNWLEIIGFPEYLWKASTACEYAQEIYDSAGEATVPPFAFQREDAIYTFADLSAPDNPFEASIDPSTIESVRCSALTDDPNGLRLFVQLLNQSLKRFLERRGLWVDNFRKRAYFPRPDEGESRVLTYRASMRQATRTVTKPFVSKRTDRLLYWEHEAISYSFQHVGSEWALEILPTYVFTKDGRGTMLDSHKVGPLTTRKSARDFNMQVYNDLIFWTWVMADGKDSFELELGDDLHVAVRGLLLSCELALPPIIDFEVSPQWQRNEDEELARLEAELADSEEPDEAEDEVSDAN
jgi:hypothetical protein